MPEETISFSEALQAVKNGKMIARSGWNGKGMFVFLKHGSVAADDLETQTIGGVDHRFFETGDNGTVVRMPCLCMRAVNGATVEGWLASQTDLLADDWTVVPE